MHYRLLKPSGFTLIELLTAISIINFIATITITNLSGVREKARLAATKRFEATVYHALGSEIIGEWKLDGNANDTSGNGFNGTVSGADVRTGTDCVYDGCYYFDAGADKITIADPTRDYGIGTFDFTVSLWHRTDAATLGYLIEDLLNSATPGFAIYIEAVLPSVYTCWMNDGSGSISGNVGPNLIDGKWHHFLFVFKRTDSCTLYIDGKKQSSVVISGKQGSISNTDGQGIGSDNYTNKTGYYDQVRIFRTVPAIQ